MQRARSASQKIRTPASTPGCPLVARDVYAREHRHRSVLQDVSVAVEDLLVVDFLNTVRCAKQSDYLLLRRLPLLDGGQLVAVKWRSQVGVGVGAAARPERGKPGAEKTDVKASAPPPAALSFWPSSAGEV